MKVNGLHSGTKFYEYQADRFTIEYHEHPETGELVILEVWAVMDGECISKEFEILSVLNPFGCKWAKKMVANGVKPTFNFA